MARSFKTKGILGLLIVLAALFIIFLTTSNPVSTTTDFYVRDANTGKSLTNITLIISAIDSKRFTTNTTDGQGKVTLAWDTRTRVDKWKEQVRDLYGRFRGEPPHQKHASVMIFKRWPQAGVVYVSFPVTTSPGTIFLQFDELSPTIDRPATIFPRGRLKTISGKVELKTDEEVRGYIKNRNFHFSASQNPREDHLLKIQPNGHFEALVHETETTGLIFISQEGFTWLKSPFKDPLPTIKLAPYGIITGRITANGNPLTTGSIHASSAKPKQMSYFELTRINNQGEYRLKVIPDLPIQLTWEDSKVDIKTLLGNILLDDPNYFLGQRTTKAGQTNRFDFDLKGVDVQAEFNLSRLPAGTVFFKATLSRKKSGPGMELFGTNSILSARYIPPGKYYLRAQAFKNGLGEQEGELIQSVTVPNSTTGAVHSLGKFHFK